MSDLVEGAVQEPGLLIIDLVMGLRTYHAEIKAGLNPDWFNRIVRAVDCVAEEPATEKDADLAALRVEQARVEDEWIRIAAQNAADANARFATLTSSVQSIIEEMQKGPLPPAATLSGYWASRLQQILTPDQNGLLEARTFRVNSAACLKQLAQIFGVTSRCR